MLVPTRWRSLAVAAVCFSVVVNTVSGSQDIMKKLTVGFAKAMEQCKIDLNVPENIMQDFYNFWREDYALVNRELGCMVMCMASKFDLITDDLKLHHVNAHEFAKKHGADDEMSKQLVGIIHGCEQTNEGIADDCNRVLETAKCFKTKIHELKWAPSMEVILEEVMADMQAAP